MNTLNADLTQARLDCEKWLDEQSTQRPDLELDKLCDSCMYVCKLHWRFQGMTGASGCFYNVGPMCQVLWRFHPRNPFHNGTIPKQADNPSRLPG